MGARMRPLHHAGWATNALQFGNLAGPLGVNDDMRPSDYFPTVMWLFRHWKRLLACAAIGISALLVVAVVALHIDERVLRHRSERLFRDIQGLQCGKTSRSEARQVLREWEARSLLQDRPISDGGSQLRVYMDGPIMDWLRTNWRPPGPDSGFTAKVARFLLGCVERARDNQEGEEMIARALQTAGVHSALVWAYVDIRHGVVLGKGFTIWVMSPSDSGREKMLGGWTDVVPQIGIPPWVKRDVPKHELVIRNGYLIGHHEGISHAPGYDVDAESTWVRFSPDAEHVDIQRLTRFNFDCLTRWRPCRKSSELMPAAWKQFSEDQAQSERP